MEKSQKTFTSVIAQPEWTGGTKLFPLCLYHDEGQMGVLENVQKHEEL